MKNILKFLTLIILTINCLFLFSSQPDIIKNDNNYKIFSETFSQENIVNSFTATPQSEEILQADTIAGIMIIHEFIEKNRKVIITGINVSANTNQTPSGANQSQNTQTTQSQTIPEAHVISRTGLYKKIISPELGEITDIKYIIKKNNAYIFIVNNNQYLHFLNIEASSGNVIKEWKSDIKPYFSPYNPKKIKPLVFGQTGEKFFIRRFIIEKEYIIILTSNDNVHIINPDTGKIIWETYINNKLCSLSVFEDVFYYVQDKELKAREIKTGKQIFASQLSDMGYDVNAYVFGFLKNPKAVIAGIPVKAGFSLYNAGNGELIYSAPYNYLVQKVKSFAPNNIPAGSSLAYSYHNGIVYVYWYDQWKPLMVKGWLSAFSVVDAKLLWNVPVGYNNGQQGFIARRIEVGNDFIKLYDEANIIILKPRR